MYLIDTKTLQLRNFVDNRAVKYAILSHRWESDEEVDFHEFQNSTSNEFKRGYQKIRSACQRAQEDNHDWIWIDTVCIDRKSSAELSEAINSMYKWYSDASICYAYLFDVEKERSNDDSSCFRDSSWFRRCWTLQELLAPTSLHFFDKYWQKIGTKSTLVSQLVGITGIHKNALSHTAPLHHFPAAQRMSWASKRTATREEDVAYSLMGIFDVNMPLLYGEGSKAFRRLQEHITQVSNDESIFAWQPNHASPKMGLLASAPTDFVDCGAFQSRRLDSGRLNSHVTNLGVTTTLWMRHIEDGIYEALLEIYDAFGRDFGIYLTKEKGTADQFYRSVYKGDPSWSRLVVHTRDFRRHTVYVPQQSPWGETLLSPGSYNLSLVSWGIFKLNSNIIKWHNGKPADSVQYPFGRVVTLVREAPCPICTIDLRNTNFSLHEIHLGFDEDCRPVCMVFDSSYRAVPRTQNAETAGSNFDRMDLYTYSAELPWCETVNFRQAMIPPSPFRGYWLGIGTSILDSVFHIDSQSTLQTSSDRRVGQDGQLSQSLASLGLSKSSAPHYILEVRFGQSTPRSGQLDDLWISIDYREDSSSR